MNFKKQCTHNYWQLSKTLIAVLLLVFGMFPVAPVFAGANDDPGLFELHGTISVMPSTANLVGDWTIGGKIIHVSTSTVIKQEIAKAAIGAYVEVKGIVQSDSSINATRIETQLASDGGAASEVTAAIEELPSTTGRIGDWKVGGKVVHVIATTLIKQERTQIAVGVMVEVHGTAQSDGSINAISVETKSGLSSDTKFIGKVEDLPSSTGRVGDWKVSGRVVHVSTNTLLKQNDGAVALGVTVKVEGIPQADGSVNAISIETKSSPETEVKEVEFRGTVESLPTTATLIGEWRVSGRAVKVSANTFLKTEYGPARVGSIVEVEGYQQTDNSVDAKKVEVESQPAAAVRNTPGYCRFYGEIKLLPGTQGWIGEWQVGGVKVSVDSTTTINQERGAVAVGALVEGWAIPKTGGGLLAVRIEVKGIGNSAGYVKLFGTIKALPASADFVGDWTVGSKTVHVTSSTRINQEKNKVAVNAFVEVEGNQRTDGSLDATSIEVKTDASVSGDNTGFVSFYDTVRTLPSTANFVGDWTVGSKTVHVLANTVLNQERGAPVVGSLVEVKGLLKSDGSIDATKIEVKGNSIAGGVGATFIEIVGKITALPTSSNLVGDWSVDGRTVRVSSATFIKREHGAAAVGVLVEVKGQMQNDGSIDAAVIEIKRDSNFTTLNRITSVNAGGYKNESSVEGIIAAFGGNLATTTVSATTLPLPTSLGGVSVLVDGKLAQLFFVSANQINYLVPAGIALGSAKVEVVRNNTVVAQGTINLPGVAPSVFSFNSDGTGVPAGYVTRVKSNGEQSNEAIHKFDNSLRRFVANPIIRKSDDSLYLIVYGTGFKAAPDSDGNKSNGVAENIEVTIGGVKAQVDYAGQSPFVGVEQLNIKLPDNVPSGSNVTMLVKVFDGLGNLLRTNEVAISIQ